MPKLRLAVLLSGSGTTLENLFEQQAAGRLSTEIVVVVSSRADAFGLERARRRDVPAVVIEKKKYKDAHAFSSRIFEAIAPYKPDLVVLAGFMSLLKIPEAYKNKVINVHPALLPAFGGKGFYGHHVHEAVLKHGCKITGCTVHYVDDQYDQGPIIAQKAVPVLPDDTPDTLAARVQAAEREIYPEAIQQIVQKFNI
ncbi:MAG TPA: phosphoribosylglycinamide formyltransferase [Planctomycetota bacterium]|nr:phosphoribosylglycinamide formyltransferase [Planctomycetota bacterium]